MTNLEERLRSTLKTIADAANLIASLKTCQEPEVLLGIAKLAERALELSTCETQETPCSNAK